MQSTNHILLVRPLNFIFNKETAKSNTFQRAINESDDLIRENVISEFNAFAAVLISKGVHVTIMDDTISPQKPDAVFPNNWASFHADGKVILYPMCAENRRHERRQDIIDSIKKNFVVKEVIDLSYYEQDNRFLEGTGSIIFDHENTMAYACLSPRTDREIFIQVCKSLSYRPVAFHSHDRNGKEVYHTNVMMCIGSAFSVICLESITNKQERSEVADLLASSGHQIIDISFDQMERFAGNMLTIQTMDNKEILVMSESAFDSLSKTQVNELEKYCELVPQPIKTIETIGGGSARCMIAEIFLQPAD